MSDSLGMTTASVTRTLISVCVRAAVLVLAMQISMPGMAECFVGPAQVIDADTIRIKGVTVRLAGIDALDREQWCRDRAGDPWPCGAVAADWLLGHLEGWQVWCFFSCRDKRGYALAVCERLGDKVKAEDGSPRRVTINHWLVRKGWALPYGGYWRDYIGALDEAVGNQRGIHSSQFTKPWEWRQKRLDRKFNASPNTKKRP